MATVRAQVLIPMDSNVPADAAVNTFHFTVSEDPVTTNLPAVVAALKAFYDTASTIWSTKVNPAEARVKFYDLGDAKPRPPIGDYSLGLIGSTGSTELPPELAICLSFQGSRMPGQVQSRRRGRIYFGPLASVALTGGLVATAARTALKNAAMGLLTASQSATPWQWVVYSETSPPGNQLTDVVNGWIDDAPDIQRRRGLAPTTRLVWPP